MSGEGGIRPRLKIFPSKNFCLGTGSLKFSAENFNSAVRIRTLLIKFHHTKSGKNLMSGEGGIRTLEAV